MGLDKKKIFGFELSGISVLHLIVFLGATAWTAILAALCYWAISGELAHHEKLIELKAEALGNQTQVLRRWIGGHGGVYVEKGDDIDSNPQLAHIPDRDIDTPGGRQLTLLNSPTILRKLLTEFESNTKDQIRLVAYKPINPLGALDPWERASLDNLQTGLKEIKEQVIDDDRRLFRMMYPIKRQKKCNRCHNFSMEGKNEVVGGLSIVVDRVHTDLVFETLVNRIKGAYFGIWCAGILGLFLFDIVAKKMLQRIEFTSSHDALTKLKNRGTIEQSLHDCIRIAQRYNQEFSILLLDIDYFKQVNDSYGHSVGDKALQVIGQTLKESIRNTDIAGRFGGEEFLILAPNSGEESAMFLAHRILEAIRNVEFQVGPEKLVQITASIGVTCLSSERDDGDSMLIYVDEALYKAKNEGRNRVCLG